MNDQASTVQDLQARLARREAEAERAGKIQAALYQVADAASAAGDLQEFYAALHRIIGELMYAGDFFIATLDEETGILSWPYHVDEKDAEIWTPRPRHEFRGVTDYVMRTGESLHTAPQIDVIATGGEVQLVGTLPEDGIFVPLKDGPRILGALAVQSYTKGIAYTEDDVELLTFVAQHITTALTRAEAIDETRRRNSELAILNSVGEAMSRSLDVKTVTRLVGDKILDIFEADAVNIDLLDAETGVFHSAFAYDKGEGGYVDYIEPYPLGTGLNSTIVRTRQPLRLGTVEAQIAAGAHIPQEVVEKGAGIIPPSWLGVPIIVGERVLGAVNVSDYAPNVFEENDVRLLQTLAANMGVAIENARLFEAEQQRVAELQIINRIQQALGLKLEPQAVIDLVGDELREVLHTGEIGIRLYDEATDLVHYRYEFEHGQRLTIAPRKPTALFREQQKSLMPIFGRTAEIMPKFGLTDLPGTETSKSLVYVPIISGSKAIGSIQTENYEREDAFNESNVRLLQTIAASMGVALENARLFDETQRLLKETEQRAAELAIINSVQEGLAAKLEIQAIYDLVGDKIREIFDAHSVLIGTFDHQRRMRHFPYNWEKGERFHSEDRPFNQLSDHLIQTRQAVVINRNVEEAAAHYGLKIVPGSGAMKSGVFVLLIGAGQVNGFVSLQNVDREDAFSESDVRLLQTLANSMSVALENARLFDEAQRLFKETEQRAVELAIINSVQQGLASELKFQAIIDLVGEKIHEVFDAQDCFIALYDETSDTLSTPFMLERGKRLPNVDREPLSETPMRGWLIRNKKSLVINRDFDKRMTEDFKTTPLATMAGWPKSGVIMPILLGDRVIGLVSVTNYDREDAFDDSVVRLLQTLASSLGVALENARLFDETQRLLKETEQRAAELAIINSVQEGLVSKLDYNAIIQLVGTKVMEIFEADTTYVAIFDAPEQKFRFPFYVDRGTPLHADGGTLPLGPGLTSTIFKSRAPILLGTMEEQRQAGGVSAAYQAPSEDRNETFLGVPIFLGDAVLGVVSVQRYLQHAYDQRQVALLQTLANSMSVALENARLFDETQRLLKETDQRAAELQIINSVQEGLASKLEMQAIYDLVGDKIRQVFDAQAVLIVTFDHEKMVHRAIYVFENGRRVSDDAALPFSPLVDHLIATRQPVVINADAVANAAHFGLSVLPGTAVPKSMIYVPFGTAQQANGYFSLQNFDHELAFSDSDVRLLQTLAGSMGIALENARLFEAERKRAAELAAISTVSQALVAEADLDRMIQLIGGQLREIFKLDIAYVALVDAQAQVIDFPYKYGDEFPRLKLGEGLTSKIIEAAQPLLINRDIAGRAAQLGTERVGRRAASFLGVPILTGGQAIGVISVQSTREEDVFNEDDLRLLSTIAANAGAAIQTARLHADLAHAFQHVDAHRARQSQSAHEIQQRREIPRRRLV